MPSLTTTATPRKPGTIFIARFFAAIVVFYIIVTLDPVNEHVIVPFTGWVVHASAFLLRVLQQPVVVGGTVLNTANFALDVRNGCNGVEAMMLLAAAMLAFPATLSSRVAGLVVASGAIQVVNIIRVATLVWLGEHHRPLFDVVHVAVWQTLVILSAVAMFIFWSVRFAKRPAQAGG